MSAAALTPTECPGEVEGETVPFRPDNACCNAPCPPGAFCNTECCTRKTEYYVQKWTCFWQKTEVACGDVCCDVPCDDPCRKPTRVNKCAFTKAWRCSWLRIPRSEVLKAFCCRKPPRCPQPADCYTGECDCFVPEDTYFAKVWEIDYVDCCEPAQDQPLGQDPCKPVDDCGDPAGCACCGVREVCNPRYVRIHCRSQIPPENPFEVPLPYYEREPRSGSCKLPPRACAGSTCPVGSNANRSPDFWLYPALPFA